MEIDLDNLVFDGLEEAQTRKRRTLLLIMTAATPVKSDFQTGAMPVFLPPDYAPPLIYISHCVYPLLTPLLLITFCK